MSPDKIIEIVRGLPGVGFRLTDDGDYDIQNKKLRNVATMQLQRVMLMLRFPKL